MSKEYIHKGKQFTVTPVNPSCLEISFQGHTSYVAVNPNGSRAFPYCYTHAEVTPTRETSAEIPASDLLEAIRRCCEGMITFRQDRDTATTFDKEKAIQTMQEWYEVI